MPSRLPSVTDQALAYKYIDQLKELAQGDSNKVWFIPTELSAAAASLARGIRAKGVIAQRFAAGNETSNRGAFGTRFGEPSTLVCFDHLRT